MNKTYIVHYIAKQWMHKPDPNGFGRCSQVFTSYDAAQQYAIKRQLMGCDALIEAVE